MPQIRKIKLKPDYRAKTETDRTGSRKKFERKLSANEVEKIKPKRYKTVKQLKKSE